jgi:tungstate transport system ATP-binding protein
MHSVATDSVRTAAGPVLMLKGLGVRVGGVDALENVDLALPLTARTVVIGPNGAGKTTLLLAIHGLVAPTRGTIGIAGTADPSSLRFALLLQKPVMLRRTAAANLEHALRVAGVPAARRGALAQAALQDVGLAYAADRPARQLSGGEQQRVAIARANALAPDCLLLDEPTSSLDPGAGAAIERYLLRLSMRGRGIMMATHDLGQARRFAEFIVFMHRGRVLETGRADDFFNRPGTDAARRFTSGEWLE